MRIINGMDGEDNTNPVLAFKEKYYEKHPIDNSYTGTLARISGQSKDDIAFLLEFADYSTKIANYDPSTRYSFVDLPSEKTISFSTNHISSDDYIAPVISHIIIDKRNYTV
jgi:hypothetical protein